MNENNKPENRQAGRHMSNAPKRPTTENFRLNLTEEQIATGPIGPLRDTRKAANQNTQSYSRQYQSEEEKRRERKAHKKRNKIKAGKNKRVFKIVWLAMVILCSLTLAGYLKDGAFDFLAASRQTRQEIVEIEIPEQISISNLAKILKENKIIDKEEFFKLYFNLTAKDDLEYVKAGKHAIAANMDYQEIIDNLLSGDAAEVVKITVVEGDNVLDIANLLEENEVCSAEDFLKEVNLSTYQNNSYPQIKELTNTTERYYLLEGYLYPDTHFFYKDSKPSTVVETLLGNFEIKTKFLDDLFAESEYTKDEIMTLASIIQKEAANVTDMYNISAILHNRLKNGAANDVPMLQCDSTIYYPYHTKKDLPEHLAKQKYESKYSTYSIEGLPAGAICNPGIDAIKAALMPSEEYSDYLYFCHSKDGTAYYARTADEHIENERLAGLRE